MVSDCQNTQENELEMANIVAKSHGLKAGDTILVVAGYPTGMGATNEMRIVELY